MPISAANISLRQLSVFAAVVDRGGFAAAASVLHMTQSAVSQAVTSLERTLDGPLLVRDRRSGAQRRLELTALGEATLSHARMVIASVDQLVADATRGNLRLTGALWVGSIRSVAAQLLAPARALLARRFPALDINVWEGTDREVHQWLAEGRVDVGLVGPLLRDIPDSAVVPLMEDPWYVACPVAHTLAQSDELELRALEGVPYVMADGGCEPAVRALFADAGVAPNVAYRAQSTDTILSMVAGGLGVTLVPELGMQAFAIPAIRMLPVSPHASRTVAAVLPAGREASSAPRLLVSALKQQVALRHRTSPRRASSVPA